MKQRLFIILLAAAFLTPAIANAQDTDSKLGSTLKSGKVNMRLGWGWHNWGDDMISGFGGVQGPAELTTSMNNVQWEFSFSVVGNDWIAFYAGLGLEWNKYRFANTEVLWNANSTPSAFTLAPTPDPNCVTRLKTRFVDMPLTVKLGKRKGWHLELTALPGFGWTSDNTGLRRKHGSGSSAVKDKDYSINRSLAPYKLDVRAAIMYRSFGFYFQVATLSTLRDGCQELYPVKFGIMI